MRERDNQAWGDAVSTGSGWSLTGRQYLLQNWRADVVLATDAGGSITDRIRYSAYGEPQRYSLCDLVGGGSAGTAPDSVIDANDYTAFINAFRASDALADVNADGVVDGDDYTIFMNVFSAGSDGPAGTGTLSVDLDSGFRRGYAGYEFDPVLGASYASVYHVRNRVYDAENGRWNKRDPLGYVDGMGLYEYCASIPAEMYDCFGFFGEPPWRQPFEPIDPKLTYPPLTPFQRPAEAPYKLTVPSPFRVVPFCGEERKKMLDAMLELREWKRRRDEAPSFYMALPGGLLAKFIGDIRAVGAWFDLASKAQKETDAYFDSVWKAEGNLGPRPKPEFGRPPSIVVPPGYYKAWPPQFLYDPDFHGKSPIWVPLPVADPAELW